MEKTSEIIIIFCLCKRSQQLCRISNIYPCLLCWIQYSSVHIHRISPTIWCLLLVWWVTITTNGFVEIMWHFYWSHQTRYIFILNITYTTYDKVHIHPFYINELDTYVLKLILTNLFASFLLNCTLTGLESLLPIPSLDSVRKLSKNSLDNWLISIKSWMSKSW